MSYQADVAPLPEPAVPAKTWRAPEGSLGKSRERLAWLLVLPSLLVVAIVAVYPLYETFRLSFTNTRLASARVPRSVGLDNYQTLLTEGAFRDALAHTIVFTIVSVALETLLGLAIALVIHSNFRGRGGVRTAMLVPWASPRWFRHRCGNGCITTFCSGQRYPGQPAAYPQYQGRLACKPRDGAAGDHCRRRLEETPFMALLLLAGLQLIPGDVYEASTVDGASKVQSSIKLLCRS